MSTVYVSPLGSGNGSGTSAANAMKIAQLNTAVQNAGPGGTVLLLADQGSYNISGSVVVSSGGLAGAPVTVRGADSAGNPMDITINGTRDPTWTAGEAAGNYI